MTEMLLCQVSTSLPRCRQRGEQRLCNQAAPLGQASSSRWQPVTNHMNRRNKSKMVVNLFAVWVGDVETRRQGIVEVEITCMCCAYQILQMICLLHLRKTLSSIALIRTFVCFNRVEFPPEGPVLAVILGGIEVAGHAPCLHLLKQVSPLWERPWPPVETLDKKGSVFFPELGSSRPTASGL